MSNERPTDNFLNRKKSSLEITFEDGTTETIEVPSRFSHLYLASFNAGLGKSLRGMQNMQHPKEILSSIRRIMVESTAKIASIREL